MPTSVRAETDSVRKNPTPFLHHARNSYSRQEKGDAAVLKILKKWPPSPSFVDIYFDTVPQYPCERLRLFRANMDLSRMVRLCTSVLEHKDG